MLTIGFPASAFATNCYVVAPSAQGPCVVVDPGVEVLDTLEQVLQEHDLRPAAVIATHGHLDHTFSVAPICARYGVPTYIHADDRYRLEDPISDLGPQLAAVLRAQYGDAMRWEPPGEVVEFTDGRTLQLADLDLHVVHAPGHTEGSVLLRIDDVPDGVAPQAGVARTILSGDVLFAGSVGRTDLPGGDPRAMARTLREVVPAQPRDALVLPGHGPATTMAHELATNPYLEGH